MKPDFFKDEDVKNLPFEARLFFQGLWCIADREGRGEDRPERLKVEIFPYDDIDTEKMMALLANNKKSTNRPFIIRYEVDNDRYFQILNWHKHQRIHHTEKESQIPPNNPPTNINIKGKGNVNNPVDTITNGELTVKGYNPNVFNDLWLKYPKKIGKKEAVRHFRASVRTPEDTVLIHHALDNYLASERVAKGFIQNASTWFNQWRDWAEYTETMCQKCKGTGKYTNKRGYEQACECPKGKASEKEENPRL